MSALLKVESLSAWYGQAQALHDVSFEVAPGEVVGILGRNGAGKSTLLRSLAGLHRQVAGTIGFDGKSHTHPRADDLARQGLSMLREGAQCASSLTVSEHLALGQRLAVLRGLKPLGVPEILEQFPLLVPLQARAAGLLSGGQRQTLVLACAFASQPKLLLMDEPSAGLAPPVARELYKAIGRMAGRNMTIVIVEQDVAWLRDVVNRNYILDLGFMKAGA